MSILKLIAYIPSIAGILIIAIVVLTRNRSAKLRYFSILSIMIGFWLMSQYLTEISQGIAALYALRLGTIFPNIMAIFFVFFAFEQVGKRLSNKTMIIISLPLILISPFSFTSLIIQSVSHQDSSYVTTVGGLYPLQTFLLVTYFIYGLVVLFYYGSKNQSKVVSTQTKILAFGLIAPVVVNLITNSLLLDVAPAQIFGPLSFLAMIGFVSYAIIRHKLFDIRATVARSTGYILSTAFLVLLYSIPVTIANRYISVNSTFRTILSTSLVILAAVLFRPLLGVFNKLTDKVFYRDAYDTQVVLDIVSSVIVGNIDARRVQKGALMAISEALRPMYATFLLFDSGEKLQKGYLVGQQWEMHEPSELTAALKRAGKKITVYDELEDGHATKLRGTLRLEDISLVSPLVTKDETIGYLIFGPKKSGNIYNSQDVGLLTIASNELAVALQNAQRFEEIQAFNITLQQKVTDATRELKETNKKLIALDEAKDEFISMASHQLRTPLTSINGYLSMLHEGDLGKLTPKQEDMVKTAYGSSQRMSFLIADFLNVSRIKTGKFVIDAKKIDLPSMVADEISQLGEMAEARGVKLIYEKPEVFPAVKLDDNKMRQVMMNMIDNAIYYTPAGGTITVQLYSTGDEVIFKVVDTGIGVPKAEQHKLFTKFYRAGNAKKARPDGTGVGLFMAQKVIVEQQGAVIFESVEGQGSTFGFRFPLAKIKA